METKALALREVNLTTWQTISTVAPAMYGARFFGVSNPEQAMAIMLKGYELGLSLAASFEFIQVVMGKPALSPRGALALIHSRGDLVDVKIKESTAETCTVWMRRKDTGFEFTRTWTMEDAQKAGVVKPDSGWEHYPANMLLWRCVGFVADVVCPDLLGGLKRADEYGAVIDGQGNVIESSVFEAVPTELPTSAEMEPAANVPTLQELVDRYGPESVMQVCDGRIPGTVEEVQAAAVALEQGNAA